MKELEENPVSCILVVKAPLNCSAYDHNNGWLYNGKPAKNYMVTAACTAEDCLQVCIKILPTFLHLFC